MYAAKVASLKHYICLRGRHQWGAAWVLSVVKMREQNSVVGQQLALKIWNRLGSTHEVSKSGVMQQTRQQGHAKGWDEIMQCRGRLFHA
jgi:hypothetical protein